MGVVIDPPVNAFLRSSHGLLIDGEPGPTRSGADMLLYDPAVGTELARVARVGVEDVDRAVAVTRRAFEGNWAGQCPADRECLLLRLAERIEAYGEQLAQLKILNNGRSINLSRVLEVGASVEFIHYMVGWAARTEGRNLDLSIAAALGARYRTYTVLEPAGVVGAVVPRSFPLLMVIWRIVPTLARDCTVVPKPADEVPLAALRLSQLCPEAGVPLEVVNTVTSTDAEAGAALAMHPGIDKLAFTGSVPVGRLIRHAAMENMTRPSLEFGGRSPVIILDDTSLDMAAIGSAGTIFFNQGQVCIVGSRLYVQHKYFDQVLRRLAAIADDLSIGPGLDPATQINPLVSVRQQERMLRMIEDGVAKDVSVVCGRARQDEVGFYVQPTILADVAPGMQVAREEIFGPVLVAIPFDGLDEVVCLTNDSIYGFDAGIWFNDLRQIMDLVPRIKAGIVQMNVYNLFDPSMPFGGLKQSGIGREMGHAAIEAYTENESVCVVY